MVKLDVIVYTPNQLTLLHSHSHRQQLLHHIRRQTWYFKVAGI